MRVVSIVYYLFLFPTPEVSHVVGPLQGHGEDVLVGGLLPGGAWGAAPFLRGGPLAPRSGTG